tara:strand:+ start:267 stop:401 length:135 start_codon:yes stop_codon:yes gene_type:complete
MKLKAEKARDKKFHSLFKDRASIVNLRAWKGYGSYGYEQSYKTE